MIGRWAVVAALTLFAPPAASGADAKDPLALARGFYNQGAYGPAIAAADEARKMPERAQSADLIAARAYLERYRTTAFADDLNSARDRLRRIDPARFTANERLEFLVGLGEALYFDESSGAAAVVFASVLAGQSELPPPARELVLDWWASALDRDAQQRPDIERQGVYQRIRDLMAVEIAASPGNAAAAYWLAAAARGQGDLQAAWDAVQAGWVRASLAGDRASRLRQDLDDLVTVAMIPERARILAQTRETLTAEWERFKGKWN